MYAKMIKKLIHQIKSNDNLFIKDKENDIYKILNDKCFKISIQFKSNNENIETNRFGLSKDMKCPHGRSEKCMCSKCDNFIIHEFELKHGTTILPSTSTGVGYCARMKYKK